MVLRNRLGQGVHGFGNQQGIGPLGGWGLRAKEFLPQVDAFLQAHAGEIVILRISHTKEDVGVHQKVLQYIDSDRLFKCGPDTNLATVPLERLRGKAIVIFDKGALKTPRPGEGLHRLISYSKDGVLNPSRAGLPICGKYAGQMAKPRKITNVAIEFGNQHGTHERKWGNKHDHLFMVYWQEAFNVHSNTTTGSNERVKTLANLTKGKGMHYNLDYFLNLHRGLPYVAKQVPPKKDEATPISAVTLSNRGHHRPNWINLDFICDAVVDKVIEFNTELMPGGRGW